MLCLFINIVILIVYKCVFRAIVIYDVVLHY